MKKTLRKLLPVVLSASMILPAASASAAPFTDDPNTKYGAMSGRTDYRTFLELRRVTNIYNRAGDSTPISALAPQTLEVKAAYGQYATLWGTWYLAETWLGDKWLYAVRPLQREAGTASNETFPHKDKVMPFNGPGKDCKEYCTTTRLKMRKRFTHLPHKKSKLSTTQTIFIKFELGLATSG
ncbi:hypothetical protein N6H14_09915 [Paenibacillus sp. CC-CFT747]|nr:hypothetical protein N6H14_09915 [Paenibacillus sp. CC-CFT747]